MENNKQLLLRLPAELHKELKTYAFFAEKPMNEIVNDLLKKFFEKESEK
jgi:hypothetical protein